MKTRILIAALFLALPCAAQFPLLPGVINPPVGTTGGTLSFVQSGSGSFTSAYQVSVAMSTGSLTAGNLYTIYTDSGELGDGIFSPAFIAGSQTYTLGSSPASNVEVLAPSSSNGLNDETWMPIGTYVLPSYSNGGTSPLIFYFLAPTAGSVTTGTFQVGETVKQAVSNATGIVYYPVPTSIGNNGSSMIIYEVTGSPTATAVWTGQTSGAIFTPTAVPGVSTGHVFIMEWHPSANPSQVGLDNDISQWITPASTTITGPTQTASGTSPVQTCAILGDTSNLTISAVNSPYSTTNQNYHGGNHEGFAGAQTATTCAWTITSATAYTRGMTFSYNPTAFTEGSYQGFDSCTGGSVVTAACLASGTSGYSGWQWSDQGPQTGNMTAATAASHPPLSPIARLGDGSSVSAGSGTLGLQFAGTGSAQERWAATWGDSFASSYSFFNGPVSVGVWWQWNASCSANSGNFISLKGTNSGNYLDANVAGACNIQIATQGGTTTTSSWTFNASEWYWVDLFFSNSSATSHTIKLYTATTITGATCTAGTTTLTTAGLPADGNITTGGTVHIEDVSPSGWNGTFSSITVSGNNISYAQTCPGSAYSSGGYIVAQLGTTLTGTAQSTNFAYIFLGDYAGNNLPSGGYVYWDSMVANFSGQDPLYP